MNITIYQKPFCPYCARARGVFKRRGVAFQAIENTSSARNAVRERLGLAPDAEMTWPQIFVGDTYVGGSDDLAAMDVDGRLDALLA